MSKSDTADTSGLEALVTLTERLTGLLANQARAFEAHRPQDAAAGLPEVTRLANLYRAASVKARAQPAIVNDAPPEIRRRLLQATEAFEAVLDRQGRALAASKTVTEGLVKAIAEEIAIKRGANAGYGPGNARRAAATAITLNRQA
ncbi:MAG: flagellar basal body protein [Caulobacterales bacterium]